MIASARAGARRRVRGAGGRPQAAAADGDVRRRAQVPAGPHAVRPHLRQRRAPHPTAPLPAPVLLLFQAPLRTRLISLRSGGGLALAKEKKGGCAEDKVSCSARRASPGPLSCAARGALSGGRGRGRRAAAAAGRAVPHPPAHCRLPVAQLLRRPPHVRRGRRRPAAAARCAARPAAAQHCPCWAL